MSSAKILVVDDDTSILDLVAAYLRREGYEVSTAQEGVAALRSARASRPDVVVLDVMLPGMDGLEVLSALRRESDAYVVMLTARSEETDKIVGLSVGADDYVTKPFSPRELVARVKAGLRRMRPSRDVGAGSVLTFRHLRIDRGSRQVWIEGQPVELTHIEFELLNALAENRGLVLTRPQLIQRVWGYDFYGEERVVDVHIGHVRQKLGENHGIVTVRSVGYRFEGDPS